MSDATTLVVTNSPVFVEVSGAPGPAGASGPAGPQGPQGPAGSGGDLSYTHVQATASATWLVTHNLGKIPSVTVIDSAGSEVEGDVAYTSANSLTLNFSAAFSGTAYLN